MGARTQTEAEFQSFYLAHWSRLVAALSFVVPEEEDAEDVAQEAFARAFARWKTVSRHPSPDGWLFLTAFRVSRGLARRWEIRRRESLHGRTEVEERPFSSALVGQVIAALPPRQRAVLILRHYYGFSTAQTASAMDCPEGTVKSLLSRAKKAAAENLGKEGSNYA